MAKLNFRDLLVKVSNVFSTDMYIVNNTYLIAGKKSDENCMGYYLCRLSPDMTNLCNEKLNGEKIYFISNIKNAKDNLSDFSTEINDDKTILEIRKKIDDLLNKINAKETWEKFKFSKTDIDNLFVNNLSFDIFKDNDKIPNITISKSVFPLLTEKNVSDLYYKVYLNNEYTTFVVSLDFPMFQLYMVYKCIDLS